MADILSQPGAVEAVYAFAAFLVLFIVGTALAARLSAKRRVAKTRAKYGLDRRAVAAKTRGGGNELSGAVEAAVLMAIAKPRRFAGSVAAAAAQSPPWDDSPAGQAGDDPAQANDEGALGQQFQSRQQAGDSAGMAATLTKLGLARQAQRDLEGARSYFLQALALFRDLVSEAPPEADTPGAGSGTDRAVIGHRGLAHVLLLLGWLHFDSDRQKAEQHFRLGRDVFERMGDRTGIARASDALAVIHHMRGELESAESLHKEALSIAEAQADRPAESLSHALIGNVLLSKDRPAEAVERLHKSLSLFDALGLQHRTAEVRAALGDGMGRQGDMEGARQEWAAARDMFVAQGDTGMVEELDQLLKQRHEPAKARAALEEV